MACSGVVHLELIEPRVDWGTKGIPADGTHLIGVTTIVIVHRIGVKGGSLIANHAERRTPTAKK